MRRALVTGGAGFIGSHLVDRLLSEGWRVTVLDNLDPFYDAALKRRNVADHRSHPQYTLVEADIRDVAWDRAEFVGGFDVIVHLAARAGVLPSVADPLGYHDVNVRGTQLVLEFARQRGIAQFVFASSSSLYGINPRVPWREDDHVLGPITPYAATKVSAELLGHVYSHLYGIRFLALRLFTVYGPRQRPDLAMHKFARLMLEGRPVPVYGDGSARRDFTHVSDIVAGICSAMVYADTPYEVFNLGHNRTISVEELISHLEDVLRVRAQRSYLPVQPGDLPQTWADLTKAGRLLGYRPHVPLDEGTAEFVSWLQR